jgi:hypothetical protein
MADHNNTQGRNIMADSQNFYTRLSLMPFNSNPEKMEGNKCEQKYAKFVK